MDLDCNARIGICIAVSRTWTRGRFVLAMVGLGRGCIAIGRREAEYSRCAMQCLGIFTA